jgi:hypothetical protein
VLEKKIELQKKQYKKNYKRSTIRNMLKLLEKEKCEKAKTWKKFGSVEPWKGLQSWYLYWYFP